MPLNELTCVTGGGNTGVGECPLDIKNMVGAILAPSNLVIAAADTASASVFLTKLLALATEALPANRIFPIHGFEQITDNSEDITIQTLGYGGKSVTREGDYDWMFQFIKGGFCLLKSLRKFNKANKGVFFYDANGVVYGVKSGTDLKPIPLVFFHASPPKVNDGTNTSIYGARFVFKPTYLADNIGFVEMSLADILTVEGLQDVALSAGTRATNVLKATAKTGCGGVNMYDEYSTELAVVGAWVAKNPAGAVLTITSVAVDANISGWTITLDASDPDYSVGVDVTLSLADPVTLAGLGVTGFESNSIVIP